MNGTARRAWTPADVALLRQRWESWPVSEIAAVLGRNKRAVWSKAWKLGLEPVPRPTGRRLRFPELVAEIVFLNREGLTDREIAARFGCARKTVTRYWKRALAVPPPSGPWPGHWRRAGDRGARP